MFLDKFTSSSKFNLYLDLISKDPIDGYHFLESIFVEIPWGDDFEIFSSPQDQVRFTNISPEIIREENTVTKALQLFKKQFNISDCFRIEIKKNVPTGAGLGGGSGDAGALLKWLSHRYGIQPTQCMDIAKKIGSDVPFFLYGGTALVEGKGEIITPLDNKLAPNTNILIIYPNIHISTEKAFEIVSPHLTLPNIPLKKCVFWNFSLWDIDIVSKMHYNIFNSKLEDISLETFYIKKKFQNILSPNMMLMSGSGSSFILFYKDKASLLNAHSVLGHVYPCSTYFIHFI